MATLDYEMDVIDVITAFLLSSIKEEIYIKIPFGYPCKQGDENKVLRLLKCLYGLKQAPMEWNNELHAHLTTIGFQSTVSDPCLYIRHSDASYVLVYVDDMIIATKTRKLMIQLKQSISSKFPCTDKGPIELFLNMKIKRNRETRTLSISQPIKINNVLTDQQLSKEDLQFISKPSRIPAIPSIKLTNNMSPIQNSDVLQMSSIPYKSILVYISITARPDIATAVSVCGQFAHNPGMEHWKAVLQILKYLKGTRNFELILGGKPSESNNGFNLSSYCDADWAGDLDKRKSRSGFALFVNDSVVCWSSKLQSSVALSSTEAEYICTSNSATMILWVRALLSEFGFGQSECTTIYQDNKSTIAIALSRKQQPGVKHIDIRHHFLRERIATRELSVIRLSTIDMIADIFTKHLSYPLFHKHRTALGIIESF